MEYRTPHQARRTPAPLARIAGTVAVAFLALAGSSAVVLAAVPAGASPSVVVATATNPTWGTVLESGGATLYILEGSKPCNAACQKFWPELTVAKGAKAKAGKGVKHAKLGSVKRSHGVRQVTYNGKPLYKFVGDHGAGQVNGNISDTWGTWAAVVTAKPKLSSNPTPTTSNTTGTTGSGGVAF